MADCSGCAPLLGGRPADVDNNQLAALGNNIAEGFLSS